jgi:uncharacterized protein YkwD
MSPTLPTPRIPTTARRKLLTIGVGLALVAGSTAATSLTSPASAATSASGFRTPHSWLVKHTVAHLNAVRAKHHRHALHLDPRLSQAAYSHALRMNRANRFRARFHGERALSTKLHSLGYRYSKAAQVRAAASTKRSVLRRPARLARSRWKPLLRSSMTAVGIGISHSKRHHRYWIDVVAARPRSTPKAPKASKYTTAVLRALNAERAAHGRHPVRLNPDLIHSAHAHNLDMARHNVMSHQCAGEPYFANRIEHAGYDYEYAGENIGWNSVRTVRAVLKLETVMYHERPPNDGHRQNILSRHFTDVGIDVYLDNTHGKVWLTEDFGRPAPW